MADRLRIGFGSISAAARGVLVVFAVDGLRLGSASQALLKPTRDLLARAAAADNFKGKNGTALDIVAPAGLKAARLIVVGVGKASELEDFVKLGGAAMGRIPVAATEATIVLELPGGAMKPGQGAARARAKHGANVRLSRLGPSSHAISSTSLPTCSIPRNSPGAPRRCASSGLPSRRLTNAR